MRLSFVQLALFRVNWKRLGLTDVDLQALELAILANPMRAPFMRGTGGLRKIRFSGQHSAAGKSGGLRVCYALFQEYSLVYLWTVFPKNEKANLSRNEINDYRRLLAQFERYLRENSRKGWTP